MNKPVVSIIVPIYNTGQKLRFLVDSILVQTLNDFELLLIDDGSTDDITSQICDEYGAADSRVKVFHKQNGGVSDSRNFGLGHAQGTFIAFADHDDYMFPDNLQTMIEEANMTGGETYDLVICDFIRCKREEIDKYEDNRQKTIELSAKNMQEMPNAVKKMGYHNYVVWNQLFKRYIIEKYRIIFTEENSEDEMFSTEYLSHITSFKQTNYKGYNFIPNENSLGSSHKYIASKKWIDKMEQLYDIIIARNGLPISFYNWRIANRLAVLCMKGYYKDSHLPWCERMKIWQNVRKDKWLNERIVPSQMGRNIHIVLIIAKYRLYYILDPIFQIYGLTNS